MRWFTSDLHFGHTGVIAYSKRPFDSLLDMHKALVANWNRCVKPDDTVFVLGDLALCKFTDFQPIAAELNGMKYLIRGNHDSYSDTQYSRLGFVVFTELKAKIAGHTVRMSHYPYALPWYRRLLAFKSELRFMDKRPPQIPGETLLHGHVHMKYKMHGNRIHVGVDAWNYRPVSQYEIEALLNAKKDA